MTVDRVELRASQLVVALRTEPDLSYLDIRSTLDRRQSFLVPLRHQPICGGLSLFTRLGRIHALYWGIAYGRRQESAQPRVRFEPVPQRAQRPVDVVPQPVGRDWWVADAQGIFSRAVLWLDSTEYAGTDLAERW